MALSLGSSSSGIGSFSILIEPIKVSAPPPQVTEALPADVASSNPTTVGKKGEAGPTNVLVVRGLDENADEEMLCYEFYKHAPIKDLRLVRDKFTHVSRGFAFLHFHTYDAVGWAPKEYNPDNKRPAGGQEPSGGEVAGPKDASSLQSGFVWDEASGYYYDASSGFYYDGNTDSSTKFLWTSKFLWII
ncbi:SUPPRESSOR OF ABI3-5 [Camellia lanceoleosa]|uniref:SUPPRESSOR OF ABI3-5 n=1 Tax=Camellia lanceoleosa TaxID=1840588 RepID=A0ACC0FEF5_9ERIC|nr:SUPPRESSOR OF ABI3-5 [Camellia lanceoleosa]